MPACKLDIDFICTSYLALWYKTVFYDSVLVQPLNWGLEWDDLFQSAGQKAVFCLFVWWLFLRFDLTPLVIYKSKHLSSLTLLISHLSVLSIVFITVYYLTVIALYLLLQSVEGRTALETSLLFILACKRSISVSKIHNPHFKVYLKLSYLY